jgi:ornithine cyclodeaminase/alanine dehydrogenase-like protein (mu-crystallin family)
MEAGAMEGPLLQLNAEDVRRVLEEIDPVELLMAQLPRPTDERRDREHQGRFLSAHGVVAGGRGPAAELVLFEDPRAGVRCVMPRSSMYQLHVTTLVALATGALLAPEEMTVALLTADQAAQCHLTMLARHVSGISHVSLTSANDRHTSPVDPRVLDLLDRAGIGLSAGVSVDEAVLGAKLLIAAGPGHDHLAIGQLTAGALVVNVAGRDLPNDLVDRVDQVYVDDLGLLESNKHRHFVTMHLQAASRVRPMPLQQPEGWHRQHAAWHSRRRIESDIGRVLSGEHPGRTHPEDILLFELLGKRVLDVGLAYRTHQIALARGLGVWLSE